MDKGVSVKTFKEQYFTDYFEDAYFIPISGYVMIEYINNNGQNLGFKNEYTKSFYKSMKNGMDNYKGTGFKTEPIKSYFGTVYCDDGDIYSDIENKQSVRDMINIIANNENTMNIDIVGKSALVHMFNEIDRNVRNHSGYYDIDKKDYVYAIQVFPTKKKIQFVIMDDGQGIKSSMNTDNAVIDSVRENTSAKSNHMEATSSGKNSGYGLYLASELSKRNHELEIIDNFNYYSTENKNMFVYYPDISKKIKNKCGNIKPFTMISMIIDIETIANDITEISSNSKSKSTKSEMIIIDEDRVKKIMKSN